MQKEPGNCMSPEEFINTAERLLKGAGPESDKRSAISRSYYGAFHECKGNLPSRHAPSASQYRSEESHKAVIDALAQWGKSLDPGRTDAQQAGRKLMRLKLARRNADYEIETPVIDADVTSCVVKAKEIVVHVKRARTLFDAGQEPREATN